MFYRDRYQKKQQGFIDTSQKIFDNVPAFDFRYTLKPSMVPAVRPNYSLAPAVPDLTINIFLFLAVKFDDYEEKETAYVIILHVHGVNEGTRYYDANIGRFISADSHVDGKGIDTQGYNRYTYARNNPVNYSDPSGHDFWSWIDGIGASIQSAIDNNRVLATIVGAVMMVTGAVLCAVGWAPLGTALLMGGYSVMSRAINGFGDLSASTSLTFDTPGVGNGNNDAKDKNNHNDSNNHNNNNDTSNTPPADTQNHGQTDDGLTVDQYADRAQQSNDAMDKITHADVEIADPSAKLEITSVITGNSDGEGVVGAGMQGYEIVKWTDAAGISTVFKVDNVVWGTESKHPYDEPTNEGTFLVTYDSSVRDPYKIRVGTPESGVCIHGYTESSGCFVLGDNKTVLDDITLDLKMGNTVWAIHSILDIRSSNEQKSRPLYFDRDQSN